MMATWLRDTELRNHSRLLPDDLDPSRVPAPVIHHALVDGFARAAVANATGGIPHRALPDAVKGLFDAFKTRVANLLGDAGGTGKTVKTPHVVPIAGDLFTGAGDHRYTREPKIWEGNARRESTEDFMQETGDYGGEIFPGSKVRALVRFMKKHDIYLYEGRVCGFDGDKKKMSLTANATVLNVKHELCHFIDWKKYKERYYTDFTKTERERMVLERLKKNRIWNRLSEKERDFSLNYPDDPKHKENNDS